MLSVLRPRAGFGRRGAAKHLLFVVENRQKQTLSRGCGIGMASSGRL